MHLIDYSHSFLSVVPPFLALALVVITRRVLLSLGIGILVGVAFLVSGSPIETDTPERHGGRTGLGRRRLVAGKT